MLNRFKGERTSGDDRRVLRPAVDIFETENEVILSVEMPGVSKDTLCVELQGSHLTIRGAQKSDQADDKYAAVYSERSPSAEFRREFQLNSEVDRHKITAHYQNGVLKVTLVKSQEALPHKIAIS